MAALWTLEGLSLLDTNMVADALQHRDAGVRETAIKLAEHFLPNAGLEKKLAALANDPDVKVRYQLLCTASFFSGQPTLGANILDKNLNDHWFRIAALATYHGREEQLLAKMLKNEKEGAAEMIASISALICLQKNEKGLNELLGLMNAKNTSTSATVAMVQGIAMVPDLAQHLAPAIRQKIIGTISKYIVPSSPASIRDASVGLLLALQASGDEVLAQKIKDALLKPTPEEGYLASCIALSAIYPSIWSQELATRFMQPDQPVEIQTATIHAFARTGPSAMQWLLNQWKGLTVPLRKAVLEQSMQDSISTSLLLGKLATGDITSSAIPWSTQVNLMNHGIIPIRKKARELLTKNLGGRDEALKAYEPALKLEGDPAMGATIFAKNCSVCHQVGNMDGIAFGPDLASVANRDLYFILSDIIKPDRSIADGYEWWEITLRNGNTVNGIIASETATAIALRDPSGSTKMINRSQISSLQASPNSVMPAGLEQNMTVAEMAHLLAFLKKPSQ
jgi:putative heme-binding domain-containing protein